MTRGRAAVRVLAAALLAVLAVVVLPPGLSEPSGGGRAVAAGGPQFCTDGDGVTVVVDLRGLDPDAGVLVRCADGPAGPGHSGFDALADAGLSYVMPDRQPGMVCRLSTSTGLRPAPGEQIAVNGDEDYVERCVNTPPAAAYWSYWYAPQGGSWRYSSAGPANRSTISGGFEGWSFSLNHSPSAAPPPRVAPDNPNAPYDGEGGNGNGGNGGDGSGGGNGGSGGGGNPGPDESGATPAPSAAGPSAGPDNDPDREQGDPDPEQGDKDSDRERDRGARDDRGDHGRDGRGRGDRSERAEESARSDVVLTGDVPAPTAADDSGPPLATVAGITVLVGLAGVAGLLAWRRRRAEAPLP